MSTAALLASSAQHWQEQMREAADRLAGLDEVVDVTSGVLMAGNSVAKADGVTPVPTLRHVALLLLAALLDLLQKIERAAGRERPYHHAPRTLDLDLLLYGDARIDSPRLTVPHPRMGGRAFVLRPLAEIDASLVAPEALAAVAEQRIERMR